MWYALIENKRGSHIKQEVLLLVFSKEAIMLIDTHAHMISEYYPDLDKLLKKLMNVVIINSASNRADNYEIDVMCDKYTNVFGTTGIHPNECGEWNEECKKMIETLIKKEKFVAVGEVGLDYYYDISREKQKEIFIEQLEMAKKHNKPVVIHSRAAAEDTYQILKRYPELKKVLHCYDYDVEYAHKFIELNCRLGINGIVTFKNNQQKKIVEEIDLKHLLAETDSPFLTPVPDRGKRNDSLKIKYIIEEIAKIKNLSFDEVNERLIKNAIEQFDLSF